MADPLCRWHYALPKNVVELVKALPKKEMPRVQFQNELATNISKGKFSFDFASFQKTAYQLAVQLGLYYVDDKDVYHPRFDTDIDEQQAKRYLSVVARSYVAPNPYTSKASFGASQKAVNLHSAIIGYASALPEGAEFDVSDALSGFFDVSLGNPDAVTALMAASPEFTKKGSRTLSYSAKSAPVDSRKDFFDLFSWPSNSESQPEICLGRDVIDIALLLFKRRRCSDWLGSSIAVNAKIREYFDLLTEADLAAYDAAEIKKLFCGFADGSGKHFEPMWSGKPYAGWGQLEPSSDGEVHALAEYLAKLKHDTSVATLFFQPGFVRPKGCGLAVTSELLMKFHPESCFKTGGVTRESMKLLDLLDFTNLKADSETEYKLICGTATSLLVKMKAMSIARSVKEDGTGDGQPADYLTVNEFLWFVKNQFKEIQNEVMNMSLETPTDETNPGNKEWKDILSDNPDDMMNRLVAALLTKPFAILAGASGTGKSRMVRKLAYMTCLNKQLQPDPATKKPIENFRMVQVKPNWHDSTELLGYRSSVSGGHEYVSTDFVRFVLKAHAFPNTPFFVCLDEMNLAPVEHYFAEFLSASESARVENGEYITDPIVDPGEFGGDIANLDPQGYSIPDARKALIEKRGLYLPKNLFVVGTVNMDDTTGGFSRKVLDRAMTIEMNEVNFDELQKPVELRLEDKQEADGTVSEKGLLLKAEQIKVFIDRVEFKPESFDNGLKNQLEDVRVKLATTPLAFAFRFARECVQYRDALKLLFPDDQTAGKTYDHTGFALDHMFLMKILPRLVGNLDERHGVVDKLNVFFGTLANDSVSAGK